MSTCQSSPSRNSLLPKSGEPQTLKTRDKTRVLLDGEVDSGCADGGKIGESLQSRIQVALMVRKSTAVQTRKTFLPFFAYQKEYGVFLSQPSTSYT
jgi:hypothetical protein